MGVQGLWELLSPVGRRVSVETLAGKKLAIDASIWMIQFMKAMRDDKGEMVRNAHILGFFRRICKLLFLRTKPVFVFDGATPSLKRRTIAARRRHRENAQAKIRKTAEKLLLNHLKAKKLEELAQEMKNGVNATNAKDKKDLKGKQVVPDESHQSGGNIENKTDHVLAQEAMDEMLAASLAAEEEDFNGGKTVSAGNAQYGDEDEDDEEMIFPVTSSNIDPAVLASLPPSMQLDLLVQMREKLIAENRQKYQKIKKTPTKFSQLQIESYLKTVAFRREINEVQKCAAGRGLGGVQSSRIASEANREFIFSSSFTGDKQSLSAKAVEKIEKNGDAVNQTVKKTINIDAVKHSLFNSQTQSHAVPPVDKVTSEFGADVETYCDENGRVRVSRVRGMGIRMTRDLQRNLDLMKEYEQEFNRRDVRTDLQSKFSTKCVPGTNSSHNASVSNEKNRIDARQETEALTQEGTPFSEDLSVHTSNENFEISFLEDDGGTKDADDDLFLHLVSGTSTSTLLSSRIHSDGSKNESDDSDRECVCGEGEVGEKNWQYDEKKEYSLAENNSFAENEVEWEDGDCNVSDNVSPCPSEHEKAISRGLLEEEADVQEAIRRSLHDIKIPKASTKFSNYTNVAAVSESQNSVASTYDFMFVEEKENAQLPPVSHDEMSQVPCITVDGNTDMECPCQENVQKNVAGRKSGVTEETIETLIVSSDLDDGSVRIHHSGGDEVTEHHVNHEEHMNTSELAAIVPPRLKVSMEDSAGNSVNMDSISVHSAHYANTSERAAIVPPRLKVSMEDSAGNSVNMDSITVHTAPDVNPANVTFTKDFIPTSAYEDHIQTSESTHSVGRKGEIVHSKQGPLMEEKTANFDALQEEVLGYNSSGISTAEELHPRGETKTQEELDSLNVVSKANLDEEITLLGQERLILGDEQRKLERNAESVSSEMFAECQELLQMFGLPYIIAPMEAEAQCAYMEMLNLVDGVVTDDSDVFLFGSHNVYKNIFDDRKYVETYFMKDIESELGLNRETLIRMALLLGSDYTEGVSGIGIVNAIEVVRAFPEDDGLQKFREWVESPDPSILGKLNPHIGSNPKKKSSKSSNIDGNGTRDDVDAVPSEDGVSRGHEDSSSGDGILQIKEVFMTKHRNVSKNWHLPSSFPSQSVITAYISPQVDDSTEPFTWGKPDLLLLRKLCWERFGWDNKKADQLLVPVLNEYTKHETQLRLAAFYTFNERFAKIRSQRIKKAVKGITGECSTDLMDNLEHTYGSGKKRVHGPSLEEHKHAVKDNSTRKSPKKPRRQRTESQNMQPENVDVDVLTPEGQRIGRCGLDANSSRRGRGRGRGRVRGRGNKEELIHNIAEASSSDDYNDKGEMEKHIQVPAAMSELRRSTRRRKHVQYAEEEENMEGNGVDGSSGATKGHESLKQDGRIDAGDGSGHEEGGSHSPIVGLSSGYLLSGGGFCVDESKAEGDMLHSAASTMKNFTDEGIAAGNADHLALHRQSGSPSSLDDDGHSRDHILSGGGFCMDGSETQADTCNFDAGLANEDEVLDGRPTEEPSRGNSTAIKNVDSLNPKEADEQGETNLGLRAMPSLRKKRRKV